MNQVHLARILGTLNTPSFQRLQKDWLINSIESHLHTIFDSRSRREISDVLHGTSSSEVAPPVAHKAGVNCLTIDDNDGRFLLSGGADASLCLFDLEASSMGDVLRPTASMSKFSPGAHTHAIIALKVYPFDPTPSTLISVSFDKTAKLISITPTSLEPVHTFPLDYAPYTIAMSHLPSAHPLVAVGTAHPATRLIDLRSSLSTHSLPGHSGAVYTVAWSPRHDHVLASGAHDGRVLCFDIRRADAAFASLDLDDAIGVVGEDLYTGVGARRPLDWNARAHAGPVTGVQWTPSGDGLVTAGHDGRIRVFSAATGKNYLVHFGPRIRNNRIGHLAPLLSPLSCTQPGKELLFWPNDDGKGDIHVHNLREGNLVKVVSTPGVQRMYAQQGKKDSVGKLTSGGRINALVWRVNAASGKSMELYSAHGNGKILKCCPADDEQDLYVQERNNDEVEQQEQAKSRKRELVSDLVAGLSNKTMRI